MIKYSVITVIFSFVQEIYHGPFFLRLYILAPHIRSFCDESVYNTIQSFEELYPPLAVVNVMRFSVLMSINSFHLITLIVEKNSE